MNPISGNPLCSRDDFARSVVQLWQPLKPYFSEGRARVSLASTAAHFNTVAAELEGFSRPLYGLAPLAAGNLPFEDWGRFAEGYANGTDPDHPEYWGAPADVDQRLVESSAISFGLIFARDKLWDVLADDQRQNVANWLKLVLTKKVSDNNWHFFPVLGSLALERCGVDHDLSVRTKALDRLEEFYVGDGWYADGKQRRFDHYIPFAMHFYGLLYATLASDDAERCQRFRDRARIMASDFRNWFDSNGASVPYGRSMTYRFAQSAFWAGLAYSGIEALPWGEIKGLWARNLRWWGERDYFDRDGVMPVGYSYPNLLMSENYNSPGSPYWAMKAYLPLALGENHPFWKAEEIAKPAEDTVVPSPVPGTLSFEAGGSRVLLISCSDMRRPYRAGADKYGKFAYSSGFGFSVDHERDGFAVSSFDNMLAMSEDGRSFFVRNGVEDARIGDNWIYSRWLPRDGIEVETWLLARPPWHVRVHRIVSDRNCYTVEGGFAIERTDREPAVYKAGCGLARVETEAAFTIAKDLSASERLARNLKALPNSSLNFPRTFVAQLCTEISEGVTWLTGAFAAGLDPRLSETWLNNAPEAPNIDELNSQKTKGQPVSGLRWGGETPIEQIFSKE